MGRERRLTEEERKALLNRTNAATDVIGSGAQVAYENVQGYRAPEAPPEEKPPAPAPEDQPLPGEGVSYQTEDKQEALKKLKDPEVREAAAQGLSQLQQERLGQEIQKPPSGGLAQLEKEATPLNLQTEFEQGGPLQRVKPPDGSFKGTDLLYMLAPAVATAIAAARAATTKGGRATKEKQWSDLYGAVGQLGQGVGQALDAGARRKASDTNRFTSEMANRSRAQQRALDKAQGEARLGLDRDKEAARAAEAAAAQEAAAQEAAAKQKQQEVEWSQRVGIEPSVDAADPRSVSAFDNTMALLEGNQNPQLQAQVDAVKAKLGERSGQVSQADIENDTGLQQLLQSITHPPKSGRPRGTGSGGGGVNEKRQWWVEQEAKAYVENTYGQTWDTASDQQKADALAAADHAIPSDRTGFRQWQVDSAKKFTQTPEQEDENEKGIPKVVQVQDFVLKSHRAADRIESSINAFEAKHGEGSFTTALQQIGGIEALLGEGGISGLVAKGRFAFADFSIEELNSAAQPLRDVAMEIRNKKFGASLTSGEKRSWEDFAGDGGINAFRQGPRYLVRKLRETADDMERGSRGSIPHAWRAAERKKKLAENMGVLPKEKTQAEEDASILDDLLNDGFQVDQ